MKSIKNLLMTAVAAAALTTGAWAEESGSRAVGTTMDDAAITASVKTRLMADEDTKARQINVETSKGVVQLNGFVGSITARNEAQRIAAGTDGVLEVRNNLEIRPESRSGNAVIDDTVLSGKVDAALAKDKRTSALSIDIDAHEGEAATEVARGVEGVRVVRNVIDVR
jgi:hyperosmotically inducible protein